MIGIIVMGGDVMFAKLGVQPPRVYNFVKNNKMVAGMLLWFGGNFLKSYVTRTHAFEVYLNDTLISSVIKSGGIMPLDAMVDQVMKYMAASAE